MKFLNFNNVVVGVLLFASSGFAQTTLPAGSNVDGDFAIGNSTNKGGLTVTGQTGNTAATGINVTGDGGVVFSGTLGTGQIPATGSGTRFMWYPKKGAIRAGSAYGTEWDDVNIGTNSIAFGNEVYATNHTAVAMGGWVFATGVASTAFGYGASASGDYAASIGDWSYAEGDSSRAFGITAISAGVGSTAIGKSVTAYGDYSVALGTGSWAGGKHAIAAGLDVQALSYASFVIGTYNVGGYSNNNTPENPLDDGDASWVSTDPLFEIGNGTPSQPRNALTVYKNGKIKMDRQGDILMGEFGNPE